MNWNRFAWALMWLILASVPTTQGQSNQLPKLRELVSFEKVKANAEQGNAAAQWAMGSISKQEHDLPQAAIWYKRAALQGNGDAQLSLGEMYGQGEGVVQDFVEAYKWLNIAATSTNAPPTNGVVFTHELTPEQKEKVAFLFETTADKARSARAELAQQMTPAQIAEGQRRSSAFVARKETEASNRDGGHDAAAGNSAPRFSGTGFFVTTNGYVLTSFHVVEDATRVQIKCKAGYLPAKLVKNDAANDIAVLKVSGSSVHSRPYISAANRRFALE